MVDHVQSRESKRRLSILNESNDGFFIAGEDLKLRGPGDFFGIRQSGDLEFLLADIYQDADVLKKAADDVKRLLAKDPELKEEENEMLLLMLKNSQANEMNL